MADGDQRFPSESDPSDLDRAIFGNRLDEARALLKSGANPNRRWDSDHLPLQEAFDSGDRYQLTNQVEYVKALLDHGADPNLRWCPLETRGTWWSHGPSCTSETAITALHFAASSGDPEPIELLLAAGASPWIEDWTGATALQYANDEVAFELISRAMFPEFATRDSKALAWVTDFTGNPYIRSPASRTPILRAIEALDGTYIVLPILAPPPPDIAPRLIPNSILVQRPWLSRLRALLRIGADPNERMIDRGFDWPPLALALWRRSYRQAEILLQHKADVNLRWCTRSGMRDGALVAAAPEAGCTAATGRTALMWSATYGDQKAIRQLLDYGGDPTLRDWQGRTAADLAKTEDVRAMVSVR